MKKLITLYFITVFCFSLVACGGNNATSANENGKNNDTDYAREC